mmetsp:Transcript_11098/g.16186  ORF Transcript_11098/g.16186 Transcript_11098/m.16186 type:complete len:157 (-) Transcript_11098:1706-2176(-)
MIVSSPATATVPEHDTIPRPIVFPATWTPLRLLNLLAVAEALSSSKAGTYKASLVKSFAVQMAIADEWHRLLFLERRIVLAGLMALVYLCCTLWLLLNSVAHVDAIASVLMVPMLLAVVISSWMSGVLFWNRYVGDREETMEALNIMKQTKIALGY